MKNKSIETLASVLYLKQLLTKGKSYPEAMGYLNAVNLWKKHVKDKNEIN